MTKTRQTVREVAKAAGVSPGLVSRKRGRDMTDAQIEEEARRRAQRQTAKASGSGEAMTFSQAQTRKEAALASLRELELATKRGELVEAAAVRAEWTGILTSVRDSMLSLPLKTSGRLAAMTDPRAIERYLLAKIRTELERVAAGIEGSKQKGRKNHEDS